MMQSATTKQVLLADDEPLARLVARKGIEQAGCFVTEAESCAQAEGLWLANRLDLVVLDHRMGDGTGLQLLEKMRAAGRGEPVIYLSAEAAEEVSEETRRSLGICAVLNKPVNMETLVKAVLSAAASAGPIIEAAAARPRHGRFLVLTAPAELTPDALVQVRLSAADEVWVALSLAGVTQIPPAVAQDLVRWAQDCRERGGCLCLTHVSADWRAHFQSLQLDRLIDLVATDSALDAVGRRLTSYSERLSVLDSVVRRDL